MSLILKIFQWSLITIRVNLLYLHGFQDTLPCGPSCLALFLPLKKMLHLLAVLNFVLVTLGPVCTLLPHPPSYTAFMKPFIILPKFLSKLPESSYQAQSYFTVISADQNLLLDCKLITIRNYMFIIVSLMSNDNMEDQVLNK